MNGQTPTILNLFTDEVDREVHYVAIRVMYDMIVRTVVFLVVRGVLWMPLLARLMSSSIVLGVEFFVDDFYTIVVIGFWIF